MTERTWSLAPHRDLVALTRRMVAMTRKPDLSTELMLHMVGTLKHQRAMLIDPKDNLIEAYVDGLMAGAIEYLERRLDLVRGPG